MIVPAAAIGDVEELAVAAGVEAVGAAARGLEALLAQPARVDQPDAVGGHVRDVERAPVGRELDVLGHRPAAQVDALDHALAAQVDHHHAPGELAGDEREASVGGEVHVVGARARRHVQALDEAHGVRLAEVQRAMRLGDDDGAPPIRGEVQVVGIADGDRAAVAAGARVDRGEAVAGVVGDPQRAQVPGRAHVLGQSADREVVDDLGRALIDDVHRVGLRVRHVHARGIAADLRRQVPRAGRRVDVDGRGARRSRHGAPGGARQLQQLAVHAGVGVAAAGHEQPVPGGRGREVRQRRRQPARRAHASRRGIDRPDGAALAGRAVAAPAEDVERPTERRAGGVGQAGREGGRSRACDGAPGRR